MVFAIQCSLFRNIKRYNIGRTFDLMLERKNYLLRNLYKTYKNANNLINSKVIEGLGLNTNKEDNNKSIKCCKTS